MSLDVYVDTNCDKCGHNKRHGSFNYTYNLSGLWSDAIAATTEARKTLGAFLEECAKDKMSAGDLAPALEKMVAWMRAQDLSKYDADNGWGTGRGGCEFVEEILACCKANPGARVTVWR